MCNEAGFYVHFWQATMVLSSVAPLQAFFWCITGKKSRVCGTLTTAPGSQRGSARTSRFGPRRSNPTTAPHRSSAVPRPPHSAICIDSCPVAGGAVLANHGWFHILWADHPPPAWGHHINLLELLTLVPSLHAFGHLFIGKTLHVFTNYCDLSFILKLEKSIFLNLKWTLIRPKMKISKINDYYPSQETGKIEIKDNKGFLAKIKDF